MRPANANPDLPSQDVLGHLLGVLDDEEHQRVEACLEQDPEYSQALTYWRQRLPSLRALRPEYEPPPGLAERACRRVAAQRARAAWRWRGMLPVVSPPGWISPARWLDVSAMTLVLVAAAALIFPAIGSSRLHAHLATCQDGLRQFALTEAQRGRLPTAAPADWAAYEGLPPDGNTAVTALPANFFIRLPKALPRDTERMVQEALGGRQSPSGNSGQDALRPSGLRWGACPTITAEDQWPAARRVVCLSGPMLPDSSNAVDPWAGHPVNAATASWVALIASPDALSALSAWLDEPSGSRGWNALFGDGHVDFLAHALPPEIARSLLEHASAPPGNAFSPDSWANP